MSFEDMNYSEDIPEKTTEKVKRAGKTASRSLGRILKRTIKLTIKTLLPFLLILLVIATVASIGYFTVFEFRGTEKEYTQYYENDVIQTEDGDMLATEDTMNIENKVIRDFYRYFAGQSFYQIVGDNDKLISPDDDNAVQDYYKREDMFKLNSNFLFSLDEFIFQEKWRYPEQFIKPVKYDKDSLTLSNLTDNEGFVIAESDEINEKTGKPTGKKIKSVRDYGLASIIKYNSKDWTKTMKIKGHYDKKDVWDEETKTVKTIPIEEPIYFEEELDGYPEKINLIDKVITFAGEIEYEYEYKEEKYGNLAEGVATEKNQPRQKLLYGFYEEKIYETKHLDFGEFKIPYRVCVDVKSHPLYMHRSADSGVYEVMPVEVGTHVEDRGDRYLKDYLYDFESYVPEPTITDFDFKDRIDYDSYVFDYSEVLTDDYGFNMGSATNTPQFKKVYKEYFPTIEKHASDFDVDPYIILAMLFQESGGNKNIDRDGIMQIIGGTRSVTATNVWGEKETLTLTKEDRKDADKSIRWAVMYFSNLLKMMDNDPYKAIQAYNFGTGTMSKIKKMYPMAWNNSYEWLIHREGVRRIIFPDTRSASYGCMPFPEGESTATERVGDSCYLENVLRYYAGGKIDDINSGGTSLWGSLKSAGTMFLEFINFETKDKDETIPVIEFKGHSDDNRIADVLRTTKSLDNSLYFSDTDLSTELRFWDEGFMALMKNSNLNLQEIINITKNEDGFLPPIVMNGRDVVVTSKFGPRNTNIKGASKAHKGVDIGAPVGTHIYASADGKVIKTDFQHNGAGNYVKIDHGNGVESLYMHMSEFAVKVGDQVSAGDIIGYVGNTGVSSGPHLHFELRVNGEAIDPISIVENQEVIKEG